MCVIIHKPKGVVLTEATFDECWRRNGDGLGFVAISKGEVFSEKGLMLSDKAKEATRPFWGKKCEAVFHFRIQSRGGVSAKLTHPFKFKDHYLFHNGTVKILNCPVGKSDTEYLSELLTKLPDDDVNVFLNYLSAKGHGKFVTVMNKRVTLIGDKESVHKNGLWFSNTKHENWTGGRVYMGDGCDWEDCYPQSTINHSVDHISRIATLIYKASFGDFLEWKKQFVIDSCLKMCVQSDLAKITTEKDLVEFLTFNK